ncbi:response regulator [Paenibacillus sp. PL2-23]|uniref:response regulator transcription factor n=1 Tax=Paenibacillus sp. PL2-23 TaxID=2100729 RepID=UPI0030F4D0A6
MYSVIIAEDSKPILRNIKMLLESSGLPIQVTATASNGEEALAHIRQQPVDILITDIRMPKLDGLALIELAKSLCPNLKVVLISSYSDFEYTRKAIHLQVFDYLLKPVERQALTEVMERILGQLQETREDRLDVLRGIVDSEYLSTIRAEDDFFENKPKSALFIGKQPFTAAKSSWNVQDLQHTLSMACSPHSCWVLPLEQSERVLVVGQGRLVEHYESAIDWMSTVASALKAKGITASIAGSLQTFELSQLKQIFEKLQQGWQEELRVSSPILLDIQFPSRHQQEEDRIIWSFADMIQQRQKEQFQLKLTELLRRWRSDNVLLSKLEELLQVISETFAKADADHEWMERAALEAEALDLLKLDSYDEFSEALLEWADTQFDLLLSRIRKSAEELFLQIDSHMQLHKYAQLSMTELAQKFHVSPSYISRIIKRFTNSTFVHHYMEMKIDEACKLMRDKPEMKIRELSDALSFTDQHYFSRVFKEYTGLSPTEFKEKHKEEAQEE